MEFYAKMEREAEMMNKTPLCAVGVVLTMTLAVGLAGYDNPVCAANAVISFKDDVLPIFKGRCVDCHQPGGVGYDKSGLDLSTYAGVMKGTKFGAMVTPGSPDTSNLVWLLDWKASPELRMPHGKSKLSICDRDAIREWIRQGAKDN
jgi:mono/diheme cytochrome c family protein